MEITEVRIKLMDANGDKLRAFCSITIDNDFVIRDLKVIEGLKGPFVAMPSRKLTERCRRCTGKNHYRARYCNECGRELNPERTSVELRGRQKLHADIAHPINQKCREAVQARILEEYDKEIGRRAEDPSNYKPVELDVFDLDLIGEEVAAIPPDADEFEPEGAGAGSSSASMAEGGGIRDDVEPDGDEIERSSPIRGGGFEEREAGWRRGSGSFGPPAGARFATAQGTGDADRGYRHGRDRPPRSGDGRRGGRGGGGIPQGPQGRGRMDRDASGSREARDGVSGSREARDRSGSRDRRPRGGNWRGPGEGQRRDESYRQSGGPPGGRRPPGGDDRRDYRRDRPDREGAPVVREREIDERVRAPISIAESGPPVLKPPEAPRPAPAHDDPPEDNFGVGLIS